jgi:hypothetical protein
VLIRLPDTWPGLVVAAVAMLALAALDLGGSFAAKEAVERRWPQIGLLGCALILQVGVIMLDRLRYGSDLSLGKWLAMGVMLTAQAYLLLAGSWPLIGSAATVPRRHRRGRSPGARSGRRRP